MVVPFLGLMAFLLSICFNNYEADDYDKSVFPDDEFDEKTNKVSDSAGPHGELVNEAKQGYEAEGGAFRKIAPSEEVQELAQPESVNQMDVPRERDDN